MTDIKKKQHQYKISGMPCPKCGNFIPISVHQIIESISIFCPSCGLRLEMNKKTSEKALETFKKISEAQNK